MTASPDSPLRREVIRRINQGWDVEGELGAAEVTMTHAARPPAWRILLEFLNPLTWLGGPAIPTVTRRLHVWIDDAGRLQRLTTGTLPHGWRTDPAWEVPDGPVQE